MAISATAFVLMYGDFPGLAGCFLSAWERHGGGLDLRIGLNACCPATVSLVRQAATAHRGVSVIASEENLGKSPMMARMFEAAPICSEWVIWFDDDSYPFRSDWLPSLEVAALDQPDVAMFGIPAEVDVDERLETFIRESSWYRGKPLLPRRTPSPRGRIEFVLGGFWALRTRWIHLLNWPDPRLGHFEDDYLLGEALRQNGARIGRFQSGVKIDTAPRRAPVAWRAQFAESVRNDGNASADVSCP